MASVVPDWAWSEFLKDMRKQKELAELRRMYERSEAEADQPTRKDADV